MNPFVHVPNVTYFENITIVHYVSHIFRLSYFWMLFYSMNMTFSSPKPKFHCENTKYICHVCLQFDVSYRYITDKVSTMMYQELVMTINNTYFSSLNNIFVNFATLSVSGWHGPKIHPRAVSPTRASYQHYRAWGESLDVTYYVSFESCLSIFTFLN